MNKFEITPLGMCMTWLVATIIVGPAAAREPAELKTVNLRTSAARLPEPTAKKLQHESEFQPNEDSIKKLASGKLKHAQLFVVQSVDLNGDKTPELIVSPDPERYDLPHNSEVVVLTKVNGTYKKILCDVGSITFLQSKTGAFRDLCIAQHSSAAETELVILKNVGGQYKVTKCYTLTFLGADGTPRETPRYVKHVCESEN